MASTCHLQFPERHFFSYELIVFMIDMINQISQDAINSGVYKVTFDFSNHSCIGEKCPCKESIRCERFQSFIKKNFYSEYIELQTKGAVGPIVKDALEFLGHSIHAINIGNVKVAFSLLRRPLKDNLFMLEWILSDSAGFFDAFFSENVSDYFDLGRGRLKPNKEGIIHSAYNLSVKSKWTNPDFLYRSRYDRKSNYSFEHAWQRANHIFTSAKEIKTRKGSLNFVFSTEEDIESQWDFLFTYLPPLLFHFYNIFETLIEKYHKRPLHELDITDLRINIGYWLWLETLSEDLKQENYFFRASKLLPENLFSELNNVHGTTFCEDKHDLDIFFRTGILNCPKTNMKLDMIELYSELCQKIKKMEKNED